MDQPQIRASLYDRALQHAIIEIDAALQILYPQNDMIDTLNAERYHGRIPPMQDGSSRE